VGQTFLSAGQRGRQECLPHILKALTMTKEVPQQVVSAPEAPPERKWFGMRLVLWLWAAGFAVLLLQLLTDLVLGLWHWV
jgi:hypothetical protein